MSLIKKPPELKMAPPGSHVVKRHIRISEHGIKYFVKAHIRKNPGKKTILMPENLLFLYWHGDRNFPHLGTVKGFDEYPELDSVVQFWLQFWQEQGLPFPPGLDPFLIKVLIAKESSFRPKVKTKVSGSSATGLMQLLQSTLYRLEGVPKNNYVEVNDNYLRLTLEDITDPVVNIAAGTRWVSHKYSLLLKEKKIKSKDLYSTIKYYHSWTRHGEQYADSIFKLYGESTPHRIPFSRQ